jgi:glycosyltransferase involved in cell wall biosynthesis
MRVLILHNRYQLRGGEDSVVEEESNLLRSHGVEIDQLIVDNESIHGFLQKSVTAFNTLYSWPARRIVEARLASFRPDVMHVHNFFPRLSPSVYDAATHARVPVVQTIHNFRVVCANGLLFREGHVCEECLGRAFGWPAVGHACYRESRVGSAVVSLMTSMHRGLGTWQNKVTRYIVLTEFMRELMVSPGVLPAHRIVIKPNAAADFGTGEGNGGYALYVGRLSPEKGVRTVLDAWKENSPAVPLKIAGDGALRPEVEALSGGNNIEYLGPVSKERVGQLMRNALVLIIPSLCYEGLPVVVPEAFSASLPIIASNLGSLGTLIAPGETGMLVPPGDAVSLRAAVNNLSESPALLSQMRVRARQVYEQLYSPESNLKLLLGIYEDAISAVR